jgi:uncharacterized membrane protein YkvA (DUF1232 family)
MQQCKASARMLKQETYALYFAYRGPRTPWYGKVVAALVVAYVFSPIDLISDVIPVLGNLDDLVLIPLGVMIVIRMLPPEMMAEARAKAGQAADKPMSWVGAVTIGAVWLVLAALVVLLLIRIL